MRFKIMHYHSLLLSLLIISACNSPPRSAVNNNLPKTLSTPIMFTEVRSTLNHHNKVRISLGLTPLRWSNTLARYAQQWASHQASTQNCFMKHRPHQEGVFKQVYGENLFWASPKRWSDGKIELQTISIAEVIDAWADEVTNYNYHSNTCRAGAQCGHYTQMVWRQTQSVGCAVAVCPDKSQLWVCNYDPAGNYIGERPY